MQNCFTNHLNAVPDVMAEAELNHMFGTAWHRTGITALGLNMGLSVVTSISAAAIKIAESHPEIETIVTMINDSGQRYFSTELCGEKKELEIPAREHPLDKYTMQELDKYQAKWEIAT